MEGNEIAAATRDALAVTFERCCGIVGRMTARVSRKIARAWPLLPFGPRTLMRLIKSRTSRSLMSGKGRSIHGLNSRFISVVIARMLRRFDLWAR